jgi:hypothetical protein
MLIENRLTLYKKLRTILTRLTLTELLILSVVYKTRSKIILSTFKILPLASSSLYRPIRTYKNDVRETLRSLKTSSKLSLIVIIKVYFAVIILPKLSVALP